jgi:hypothetical protein
MPVEDKGLTPDPEGGCREAAIRAVADHIRKKSAEGLLVQSAELFSEINRLDLVAPGEEHEDADAGSRKILEEALKQNDDLRQAAGRDGFIHYYSNRTMTDAYAGILFLKQDDPLRMMAETIRNNSRIYPRPIPLNTFAESPFDLTREEIEACLQRMAGDETYRDIARTQTSIGTHFLYSTLHLEPDHASMLAEWYDVGQAQNP